MERALGESEVFDVFAEFSGGVGGGEDTDCDTKQVKRFETYTDKKWTENRPVMDVRTSTKFNELFLGGYGQRSDAGIRDPDGCVVVWSLPMTKRPEYVFTCQSAVCTALFDKYQPNVIIGGVFTGSILVWDMRAKMSPVQRTPLSSKGHQHPVYSVELVGTQHANNLVSVDMDGRLCLWSRTMMVHPTETLDFKKGNRDMSPMSIGFAEGETNVLFGGTEDGCLFQAHIHGSKKGITDHIEAHMGPITGVHWHGATEGQPIDFTDLLLTSSFDWTIKLWSPKAQSTPIHSFEVSEDVVCDAKWHPSHPAVFASVDGEGNLDMWDMNQDIEIPVVRTHAQEEALTKCCWSTDGRRLLTGDCKGDITVWSVSTDLHQPKPDDWTKLEEKVDELKSAEKAVAAA